jgi:hypothetical protein
MISFMLSIEWYMTNGTQPRIFGNTRKIFIPQVRTSLLNTLVDRNTKACVQDCTVFSGSLPNLRNPVTLPIQSLMSTLIRWNSKKTGDN